MGERYERCKSSGPQRQTMKNQISNRRVPNFDAIRLVNEEEIP